jgi:hypothetical protein
MTTEQKYSRTSATTHRPAITPPALRTLPLQVRPLPGEPLDSWYQTYAHRLGATVGELLTALGLQPDQRFVVDHTTLLHQDEADRVARLTGVSTRDLHAMTLRQFAGHMVSLESTRRAVTRSVWWGRGAGSRFCSQCLTERDGRWLLRWRLSWVFACTRHNSLLHDHCAHCGTVARKKTLRPACELPPAQCTTLSCGADLRAVQPLPLAADDPILSAQRSIDTMIDAIETHRTDELAVPPSVAFTDLRAVGGWLLRQGETDDFNAYGPQATRAWSTAQTRYQQTGLRPSQFPPIDAALMGALVTRAQALITEQDTDAATLEIRRLMLRSPRRVHVCPPGLDQQWQRLTTATRALFIRAGDIDRGHIDRLRLRSCTASARLPAEDGSAATTRARHLPQLLWPRWTIRLMPAQGFHSDPFRAVMSLSLLIPGDGRRPVTRAASHLHPHISRVLISSTLQRLSQQGHHSLIPTLCELAERLDRHGSPIDYEHRRSVITPDMLSQTDWQRLCRDTEVHPGKGTRFTHAQRYLLQRLTGCDLTSPTHPRKFRDANDRSLFLDFITTLTTPMRHALDQHAEHHLHDLGIDEPLQWEPPRNWAPSLNPPGREPDDIDTDRLRNMIVNDSRPLGDVARELDTGIEHVRLVVEGLPRASNARVGVLRPGEAWKRREHARTILTRQFLDCEYIQQGKDLRQIGAETNIPRHIVAEIAKEAGYALTSGRRRIVIDEQWLRQQYVEKLRSFPDIATECGVSEMTVTRCARQYGISAREPGITSHPQMIHRLDRSIPRDVRRAVESGLHGWQRLFRFRAVMEFPTVSAAARELGINQATLIHQLQRLEHDVGNQLYTRSTVAVDQRPTRRGAALLRALDRPEVRKHLDVASTVGTKAGGQQPRKNHAKRVVNYRETTRKEKEK